LASYGSNRDRLWLAVLAALVVSVFVLLEGGDPTQAIVGGTEVKPVGKYPFMAFIRIKRSDGESIHCGGTLIDRDSVLTAAHCGHPLTVGNGTKVTVAIGQTDLRQRNQGKIRVAAHRFIHPRFDPASFAYDAAVLKLASAVTGIKPIALATAKQNYLENPRRKLTVTGWGTTSEGDKTLAVRIREVGVPVVSDAKAQTAYSSDPSPFWYRPSIMIAAGVKGKDHCYGDSGGPLFKPDTPGTQIGIASYAIGCARAAYPGVSTEVNNLKIRNFILRAAKR